MEYSEVRGNLLDLAMEGKFDVITHGCNCFCTQGAGIALQMARIFSTDKYPMEHESKRGDINKLGCIEWETKSSGDNKFYVVNSYTQYGFSSAGSPAVDYEAITLCMRKINRIFRGLHIGIPGVIGCGLAGGNEKRVKEIIKKELVNCKITIVYLN